jgi:hypothetical protein
MELREGARRRRPEERTRRGALVGWRPRLSPGDTIAQRAKGSTPVAEARTWLDVPFSEKGEAKALGARWDPSARRWYTPRLSEPLKRWVALPEIAELLPGEDRSFGAGLFVDLVPRSCWFTNVRSCVGESDWERLRRMITRRSEHRCEACGQGEDRRAKRWLEAHERWEYRGELRTQLLRRLVCLCTPCHTATHFGLAQIKGKRAEAKAHLRVVTGMSDEDSEAHIRAAFSLWEERSRERWSLDLSILTSAGVTIVPPPHASARAGIVGEVLRQAPRTPPKTRARSR